MDPRTKKTISSDPYTVYIGVAAEDLGKDSTVLKIICPELIPNTAYGTVGAGITQNTINLKDRDGNPVSSQVTSANHLVATWEGQSNQRYPPLVREGEPVEVYKTGDQDKFYWRTSGKGRDFRTTDRLHFEIGATDPSKPGVQKDDTNTYSMWMDSDQQTVGFKTAKANGEACALFVVADLKAGTLRISDDSADPGNRIYLDTGTKTGTPIFQVNLTSGAVLKFEKDDAFIKIPKKFLVQAGDRIVIDSPLFIANVAQKGAFIINAANVAINTTKDVVITAAGVLGLNAASTKISGVLVAAVARIGNAIKGPFGSPYKNISVQNPTETPVIPATNTADVDPAGLPYKTL